MDLNEKFESCKFGQIDVFHRPGRSCRGRRGRPLIESRVGETKQVAILCNGCALYEKKPAQYVEPK